MKILRSLLLASVVASLAALPANAATITILDGTSTSKTLGGLLDASGNFFYGSSLCGSGTVATLSGVVGNCAIINSFGQILVVDSSSAVPGSTAPNSATLGGWQDGSGNIQANGISNRQPVDASHDTLTMACTVCSLFGSAGANSGVDLLANGGTTGTGAPVIQAGAGAGISTPGPTIQLVAASSGKKIYITGYNFMSDGASGVALETGVSTSFTFTISSLSGGLLTVTGTPGGTLAVGQTITGGAIPVFPPAIITSLGTGTGAAGTYNINNTTAAIGSTTTMTSLTPCASSVIALTGAYPLSAQAGVAYGNGLGSIAVTPASVALCLISSAAAQVSGLLSFVQF